MTEKEKMKSITTLLWRLDSWLANLFKLPLMKFIVYGLLFLFIFSFGCVLTRDPDFGWHLRYGNEILAQKKISTTDTFTHTIKGSAVVNTEWLNDLTYSLIYSRFSFIGLSVFFALVVAATFTLPAMLSKSPLWIQFLVVSWALLGSLSVIEVGPRPQLLTLFFFSILLSLLFLYQKDYKLTYLFPLPFIFLLWANCHPAFFLGLAIFPIIIFGEFLLLLFDFIKKRKVKISLLKSSFTLFLIAFLSFVLTNFRPKAGGDGRELLSLVKGLLLPLPLASSSVRWSISEWLPPFLPNLPGMLYFLAVIFSVGVFAFKNTKRTDLPRLLLLFFFIYFSSLSRRNVPLFMIVFIILMIENISFYFSKLKRIENVLNLITVSIMVIIVIWLLPSRIRKISKVNNDIQGYCQETGCPYEVVKFLREKRLKGNMFNEFDWGGFFVWQLPEYPVFIDGRVPGTAIFDEYQKVNELKKDWKEILDKYSVNFLVVSPSILFEEVVKSEGWKKIYSDNKAVVFVRDQKNEKNCFFDLEH